MCNGLECPVLHPKSAMFGSCPFMLPYTEDVRDFNRRIFLRTFPLCSTFPQARNLAQMTLNSERETNMFTDLLLPTLIGTSFSFTFTGMSFKPALKIIANNVILVKERKTFINALPLELELLIYNYCMFDSQTIGSETHLPALLPVSNGSRFEWNAIPQHAQRVSLLDIRKIIHWELLSCKHTWTVEVYWDQLGPLETGLKEKRLSLVNSGNVTFHQTNARPYSGAVASRTIGESVWQQLVRRLY